MKGTRKVSDFFMSQSEKVISEGLVNLRRSNEYSKNLYYLPVPKEAIETFGSKGFSPAHVGNLINSIDFYVPEGTKVLAAADGLVVSVRDNSKSTGNTTKYWNLGNYIDIMHKNEEFTWYEHLQFEGAMVKAGDSVKRGQVIAFSGNTGFSENAHLHFQVNSYFGSQMEDYVTLKARFKDFEDVYRKV